MQNIIDRKVEATQLINQQDNSKLNIIGTWMPTHHISINNEDIEQEHTYTCHKKRRIVFAENGIVTFHKYGGEPCGFLGVETGKWSINNNILTIDWGDRIVDEIVFEINEDTMKKGNFYRKDSFGNQSPNHLYYNKYEKVAA